MGFSDRTPDSVKQLPQASGFLRVLDGVQEYKESLVFKGARFYNPVLLTNLGFLKKWVDDYGYPPIPTDFPKAILDNLYLNAEAVFRLQGSTLGLDYLLRVLTEGDVTIDASEFFPKSSYIILSDFEAGYLFAPEDYPDNVLYLYNGIDNFLPRRLDIAIATPYDTLESLHDYITTNLLKFIGFTDENTVVNITFTHGPRVPVPYANQYFVNP